MITLNLHQYQKDVVNEICRKKRIACWLDMGLGKTIICLTAMEWLIKKGKVKHVLVVAPKTVAENVWQQECEKWHIDLTISLVVGNEKQRLAALHQNADVYVIGRDNVHWLFLQNDFTADMLVVDESTSFKDRSTRRWASFFQKSIHIGGKKYFRKTAMIDMFDRVVLLSGTPASESYACLWSQIAFLDPHNNPLGKTLTEFRIRYMVPQMIKGYPVYTRMKENAVQAINERLVGLCISMKTEDYLQLPEQIEINRYFEPNEQYKIMADNGVLTVGNDDIIAGDILTRYNKLQQLTSGFIYNEHGKSYTFDRNKLSTLVEILESTDENVLIMYHYDYEKEQLMRLGGVPLDNQQAIQKWNNGNIRVGLLYPASGGYGLNLADGGSIVVWYTLPLSLEQYLQANKRLHRQGQKHTVRIIHLLGTNTIDEYVLQLLNSKQNVLDGLMEYFKNEKTIVYGGDK